MSIENCIRWEDVCMCAVFDRCEDAGFVVLISKPTKKYQTIVSEWIEMHHLHLHLLSQERNVTEQERIKPDLA